MARHGRLLSLLALAAGLYSQVHAQPVESPPPDVAGELRGPTELLGAIDINDLESLDKRVLGARREFPPPSILPPPQIVYRGDKRSPEELEALGGFLPSSEVAPTNENNGFSLYMHHLGFKLVNEKRVTAYVSTTRFFGTALGYANMASKEGGWIYEIQALPHMIDSDGTLLQGRRWRNEFEISALGGVSWAQVKSAVKVPGFKKVVDYGAGFWSDVTVEGFKQKMPEAQWFNNTNYNSTFTQFKASPGQPQLAGWFDEDHEQYKAQEPWSLHQTKTVEEYYMDFMNQFGGPVGWTGTYPLVLPKGPGPKAEEDKLCAPDGPEKPNKYGVPEDECRRTVAQCVFEQTEKDKKENTKTINFKPIIACWCDFSIDTNYYDQVPDTGVVREYFFDLEQLTASPDGFPRVAYAFNGMVPGPTIEADWGDTVVVHVSNNLTLAQNGTSIHFHGLRQNYTNEMDGVTAITQCPLHAGGSMTYRWRATQYGTSWYHSHIGLQAWDGAAGSILIHGPATADYDVDKGTILLSDWTHQTASSMYTSALTGGPPRLSNGLINGTNTWNNSGTVVGHRFNTSFTAGEKYRLRLINGALDTHHKFTIDNHTMTVIAADFVPIVPYQTTVLDIGIGQRYDVIVTADQQSVADNFWIRALPQRACSNYDDSIASDIRGIAYYGNEPSTPTTSPHTYVDACIDEPIASLVPHVSLSAGTQQQSELEQVSILPTDNVFLWAINGTSFYADWDNPTLLQIYNNATNYTTRSHVISLDQADIWVYIVIEAQNAAAHPIHLHGHDFYIVAQGSGSFDASTNLFSLANPMRRDVAMLPGSGHLVLAFKTDNPGAWLMHCHIGWHTNMGLALQFVERLDEARKLIDYSFLNDTCAGWDEYTKLTALEQEIYDDGI